MQLLYFLQALVSWTVDTDRNMFLTLAMRRTDWLAMVRGPDLVLSLEATLCL